MSWNVARGITTPRGVYTPQSDDLARELVEAAKFAGLRTFNVKIDGYYVPDPSALQTNSIAALAAEAIIEAVEVEAHDVAGWSV